MSKPYEISIWQKELDITSNSYKYYRFLTIGTDQMEYQGRAIEPKLTSNTNGTHTLSFNMYYKFIDNITGETVQNEYVPYLKNETQLYVNFDNEEYLFNIKEIKKDTKNNIITYSCEDSFITELSKNGYNIEFDQVLNNNYGHIADLAELALAGSDWTVDKDSSDKLYETMEEPLIRVESNFNFNANLIKNTGEILSDQPIAQGTNLLIFYSSCTAEVNRIQFIKLEDTIPLEKGSMVIMDNNNQYFIDLDGVDFKNGTEAFNSLGLILPQFYNNTTEQWADLFTAINNSEIDESDVSDYYVISQYRGRRYVFNFNHEYNSKLNQIVDIFKNSDGTETLLRVNETEVETSSTVAELVTNGIDFQSTSGWNGGHKGDTSTANDNATIEQINESSNGNSILDDLINLDLDIVANTNYTTYLKIKFTNSNSVVYNSGFFDNRAIIQNLVNGDIYKCRLVTKDDDVNLLTNYKIVVASYMIDPLTSKYTINQTLLTFMFNSSNESLSTVANSFYTPETFESNNNRIGIFIYYENSENSESESTLIIKEISIFKYYGDSIYPTNTDINGITPVVSTKYYFYNKAELNNTLSLDQISPKLITSYNTPEVIIDNITYTAPLTAEKYKAIIISKSNYFNILQSLCEIFECWVRFNIHFDNNTNTFTKKVSFHKYIGQDNFAGIKYGVNLTGIQRTDKTNNLVTKLIVAANAQEMADQGFCSITESNLNETGENILYNFDYFVKKGDIDVNNYRKDLYDLTGAQGPDVFVEGETNINGYNIRLRNLNTQIKAQNQIVTDNSGTLKQLNSDVGVYEQEVLTAEQYVLDATADFETALGFRYSDLNVTAEDVFFENPGNSLYLELTSYVTKVDNVYIGNSSNEYVELPIKYYEFNIANKRLQFITDKINLKVEDGKLVYTNNGTSYNGKIKVTQNYSNWLKYNYSISSGQTITLPDLTQNIKVYNGDTELTVENNDYNLTINDRNFIESVTFNNSYTEVIVYCDVREYSYTDVETSIVEKSEITIPIEGNSINLYVIPDGTTKIAKIANTSGMEISDKTVILGKGMVYISDLTIGTTYNITIQGTFYILNIDTDSGTGEYYLNLKKRKIKRFSLQDTLYTYRLVDFKFSKSIDVDNLIKQTSLYNPKLTSNGKNVDLDKIRSRNNIWYNHLVSKELYFGSIFSPMSWEFSYDYIYDYDSYTITTDNEFLLYNTNSQKSYNVKLGVPNNSVNTTRLEKATSDEFKKYLESIAVAQLKLTTARINLDNSRQQLDAVQKVTDDANNELQELVNQKKQLNAAFNKKYQSFIQEGTWIDEKYIDPNEYYLDAQQVLYNSCYPVVSYSISAANLSEIEGYEDFNFKIGDRTFIEDADFFGADNQEEVVITEIVQNFDNPSTNSIKVQTVRNQFQDLFQAIQATVQSLQFAQGGYKRAAELAQSSADERTEFLQDAFNKSAKAVLKINQYVEQNEYGVVITDKSEANKKLIINSGGLLISKDGGQTWSTGLSTDGISASLITAGSINTNEISIFGGDSPTFKWDKFGLTAYWFDASQSQNGIAINNIDTKRGVRYDRYGIYGYNKPDQEVFTPTNLNEITTYSNFYLTWEGLGIRYNDSYVKLGKMDEIEYNSWNNTTGLPFFDSNNPELEKFIPIMEVGDSDSANLRIYSDGTVVCNDLKITGSIKYAVAASPNQTVYHQGKQGLTKPSDNTYYNQFKESSTTEWHKTKSDSDKYYATTTDGGATWSGPYLLSGIENYQIELSATQTAFYNGEGSTTITARVYLNGNEITSAIGVANGPYSKYQFKWTQDGKKLNSITNSVIINGSSISGGSDNITCILEKTE